MSSWRTVTGSGHVISESRTVSNFDQVSVSGSGELTVSQGDDEALTIEADDNFLPLIRSEVVGSQLKIGPRDVNLRPSQTIRYTLKVKNLNAIDLSGSLRAQTGPLKTEQLDLRISGSGRVQIAKLDASRFGAHISGSGDTLISGGEVAEQSINVSGSGDHRAPDVRSDNAQVNISGSGHATLWVNRSLSSHISGSGTVEYYGSPSVDSHTSGAGRVRRLGDKG